MRFLHNIPVVRNFNEQRQQQVAHILTEMVSLRALSMKVVANCSHLYERVCTYEPLDKVQSEVVTLDSSLEQRETHRLVHNERTKTTRFFHRVQPGQEHCNMSGHTQRLVELFCTKK